ncbi:gag-pol fusion protein [Pimephales promelas]|nr:gag-pol fusion protein [Pimephales promelas]
MSSWEWIRSHLARQSYKPQQARWREVSQNWPAWLKFSCSPKPPGMIGLRKVMAKQDQRWRNMQHQFQQIQHQVIQIQAGGDHRGSQAALTVTSPEPTGEGMSSGSIEPRLHPLTRDDDIEQFLTTFERMATACRWPQANWAIRLVPLLTGKACGAYVAMDGNDAEDYEKVKEAILMKYQINAEIYRQRFRSSEILPDENPRELYVRLKDLFSKWVKPERCTIQQLSELIILEQFMRMINSDMAVWIKEHDPATAEEAAKLAETYLAARQEAQHSCGARSQKWPSKSGGEGGHGQGKGGFVRNQVKWDKTNKQEVRCYYCGEVGHTKPCCPSRKVKHSAFCHVPRPYQPQTLADESGQTRPTDILIPVLVNGQSAKALVDTGSSQTLVQDSLVSEDEYITQESLKVCCVHGEVREYPIAEIYLTVQGQTFLLHVAVASQLPHEVVLGRDLPILCDLVPKVQPCYAVTRAQSAIADFKEMPFAGVDIEVAVGKRRTSKKERRKRKFEGRGKEQVEELPLPECSLDMTIPEDIAEVQKNDPTLQDWFQKVSVVDGVRKKVGSCLVDEEYIVKKGILYQVYKLLGIRAIKTTPYHPQTDGLVERFNQTLKSMLRKFVSKSGSDWDQWLPYLLFAYREVPQASTGFSPFELLYGRQVRGPLDLLKEKWEGPKDGMCSVVQYVVQMRERLEEMTSLAQENIRRAQQTQKVWYDKRARERSFEPGQKVLLLLPTSENKLLAKWHGPYEVLRKTGRVTYEISMPERGKKKQNFHVNLLKEFHHRKETEAVQLFVRVVGEEDEPTEQYFPTSFAQQAVDLSHLEQPQIDQIKQLVDPRLFQEKPGCTNLVRHDVILKEATPARQKSYRIPERLVTVLKDELDIMLSMGVIEPSLSEWCSPIVLVPKKDGTLRFCIDFRQLNSLSKVDPYPMPRIDELVERLGRAKYLSTVDLCKGYWQVPLTARAKQLTAFKTPFGLFHFRVMPFGLQGAPATFQRLMDQILQGTREFAAAYLDDVVIFSETWEEHCQHLQQVLGRIKAAGLTINPKKCIMAKREISYLGFVIGGGVIRPQQEKIEAIRRYQPPTTKKQVRSFLGLVGWYRRFIPNFSARASVLTDLTRSAAPNKVVWTEQGERAFRDLREAVCGDSVLLSPDFQKPFILQTDASGVGLGAVLLQEVDGDRRPVAFLSRKLFPRETRYSTVEQECLAIKWATDSLRYYLLGRPFVLETDHRALQWLERMKDSNARITRWSLSLQPYQFTVKYCPGARNKVADFLSRIPEEVNAKVGSSTWVRGGAEL